MGNNQEQKKIRNSQNLHVMIMKMRIITMS